MTPKVNCQKCFGRGYRVRWVNNKGRTRPCGTCNGTGSQKPRPGL